MINLCLSTDKKISVKKVFPTRTHAFSKIKGPEPYSFFIPPNIRDKYVYICKNCKDKEDSCMTVYVEKVYAYCIHTCRLDKFRLTLDFNEINELITTLTFFIWFHDQAGQFPKKTYSFSLHVVFL